MRAVNNASPDMPRVLYGVVGGLERVVAVRVEVHGFARHSGIRAVTADVADVDVPLACTRRRVLRDWLQLGQDMDVEALIFKHVPRSGFVGHSGLPYVDCRINQRYSSRGFESIGCRRGDTRATGEWAGGIRLTIEPGGKRS